jgi:RecQ family ATP-dependent DNA helicase
MADHEEDEFGMGVSDDEDFLAAELDATSSNLKRKEPPSDELPPSKRPANAYPTICKAAVSILKDVFKMNAFRLKQEAAISRLLHGGSAVVVFPTGGGKSLCYQVPALVFEDMDKLVEDRGEGMGGITLVVSPLIALMKDQVDALLRRGVKAAVLDSTRTREQYLETMDSLRAGTLKLLYCAPERLNNEGFVESMKYVRGGIRLVAIDEAHCISEWGHAFRPDYLKVARFVREVKAERVVCLTATATPKVAKDIREAFDIDETGLFRTSSYRSNLQLLAESAATKQNLYPKLFSFLTKNPGPTIIYVTLQKQTEALASNLRKQGFKAQSFHAGMQIADKIRIQDNFMAQNDLIIVATVIVIPFADHLPPLTRLDRIRHGY